MVCAVASPALGQGEDRADAKRAKLSDARPVAPNATVNLLNLMVKRKLLTQEEADGLIQQADTEAYVQRQAAKEARTKADEASKVATEAASAANPPGTRHVHGALPGHDATHIAITKGDHIWDNEPNYPR